jgi:hypothetical protein
MKKLVKINYKDITNIVKQLVKEQEDDTITISPEEFKQYLEYVSYKGDALTKFPKFRGKKIIVNGDLDLSGTPLDSLGPLLRVNGRNLNITNTQVKSWGILDIDRWRVSYQGTPLKKMEEKRELNRKMAVMNSKREDDEWAIENDDDIGLRAQALLKNLYRTNNVDVLTKEKKDELSKLEQERERLDDLYGEETDPKKQEEILDELNSIDESIVEFEEYIDVYDLYNEDDDKYYRLTRFIPLKGDEANKEYAVGTQDEIEKSTYEYVEQLIDDIGIKGFTKSFVEDYISVDSLIDYFDYDSDVRNNLDVYFSDDDNELSGEQELEIQRLNQKLSELQEKSDSLDITQEGNDELYDELQSEMDDILSEIDDIESSPEGEPSEEKIEDKVDELNDEIKNDPMSKINELDLDMGDFVDIPEFIQGVVDADGYGQVSSYDGEYDVVDINGVDYYIVRLN